MIHEKTQEYENINTYRTIKMMMERKNSKKEPTINISLACAASSYPQIHRLFEKQKTSSPAKRFRWLYVRVCVGKHVREEEGSLWNYTSIFLFFYGFPLSSLCTLKRTHTHTHICTWVHARLIVAFVYRKCDKTCIAFYTAAATTIGHMMGTTTNNIYTNIHSHMFENLFLHPFFEFLCYQTHIHGHCLAF